MQRLILIIILSCSFKLHAQWRTVVDDNLTDRSKFTDLSTLLFWGKEKTVKSAFDLKLKKDSEGLTFKSISLNDSGIAYGSSYTDPLSLKTSTAIEYYFPPIIRRFDTIFVEFDAIWNELKTSGESGRIVVSLLYDLQPGGVKFGDIERLTKYHPYGRPTYNFRLLNALPNSTNDGLYMLYGGGKTNLGESEKTNNWWLPGFSTSAGGFSPGSQNDYPLGGTAELYSKIASATQWMHYTWKIFPERLELWYRPSKSNASSNLLALKMHIPFFDGVNTTEPIAKLKAAYKKDISTLPIHYNYFNKIEALRFYYRAGGNASIANVKLTTTAKSTITSLESKTFKMVRYYPNPAQENVYFDAEEVLNITITNVSGKIVKQTIVNPNEPLILNDVPSGLYIMKIEGENVNQTSKIHLNNR